MTQVAIVIDLPYHDTEHLVGQNTLRIAEHVAQEFRNQVPVDEGIRVVGVYIGKALQVDEVLTDAGVPFAAAADEIE